MSVIQEIESISFSSSIVFLSKHQKIMVCVFLVIANSSEYMFLFTLIQKYQFSSIQPFNHPLTLNSVVKYYMSFTCRYIEDSIFINFI